MVRHRKALAFVLALSLVAPALLEARERGSRDPLRLGTLSIGEIVREAWGSIQSLWEKEGSSLDPFGKPTPPPSGTTGSSPQTGEIPTKPEG